MSVARRRFAQESKDELCREVISASKPITEVSHAYGNGPETLRNWLHKYREAPGATDRGLSVPERARLKQLERENQELRAETAFLNRASAHFAREKR
jgi:transposase